MKSVIYKNRFNDEIAFVSGPYNKPNEIRAICDGKIYYWNPNANGYPGAIQHGGNFLHGTEYRIPSNGGGAWERETIATGAINH